MCVEEMDQLLRHVQKGAKNITQHLHNGTQNISKGFKHVVVEVIGTSQETRELQLH